MQRARHLLSVSPSASRKLRMVTLSMAVSGWGVGVQATSIRPRQRLLLGAKRASGPAPAGHEPAAHVAQSRPSPHREAVLRHFRSAGFAVIGSEDLKSLLTDVRSVSSRPEHGPIGYPCARRKLVLRRRSPALVAAHKFVKLFDAKRTSGRFLFALESNCDVGYVSQDACGTKDRHMNGGILRSNGGYSSVGRTGR